MTHIIASKKAAKKITIDPNLNAQIKDLHRKLVALSFTNGNQSSEYQDTLRLIHQLRRASH